MRDLLNKKKYQAFRQRCASAGVTEVYLYPGRVRNQAAIAYNAREPRSKRLLNGEWLLGRDPKPAEEAFLEIVKADFAVVHHGEPEPVEGGEGAGKGKTKKATKLTKSMLKANPNKASRKKG
ncbi:MAG: hypothetical protein ACYTFT_11090 [Planctomycetota bacterium]